jgi:hypothetical protein
MPRSEDRKSRRWLIAREIVNRYDPAGLLALGTPEDEYDPEMPGVLFAVELASDANNLADRIERSSSNCSASAPGSIAGPTWPPNSGASPAPRSGDQPAPRAIEVGPGLGCSARRQYSRLAKSRVTRASGPIQN